MYNSEDSVDVIKGELKYPTTPSRSMKITHKNWDIKKIRAISMFGDS